MNNRKKVLETIVIFILIAISTACIIAGIAFSRYRDTECPKQ